MEPTAIPPEQLGIPAAFHRYVDAKSPPAIKMMAAQGLLPAPPKVMLPVLVALSLDVDPQVSAAGVKALQDLPSALIKGSLGPDAHPAILSTLSAHRRGDAGVMELVLLHPKVDDDTLFALAEEVNEAQLALIANNQKRLLAQPELLLAFKSNPAATPALIDRVESFLLISGALKPEDTGDVHFPPELIEEAEEEDDPKASLLTRNTAHQEKKADETNLWAMIQEMGMGEKIQLATKGNATARSILIRSPNKMIALATINSPRMTDKEVLAIAQNRNVIEEVLRIISVNRGWMRRYDVKLALVNNPKVPVPISIKLVPHLRNNELKALSKNRNVPRVVAKKAKDLLSKRTA